MKAQCIIAEGSLTLNGGTQTLCSGVTGTCAKVWFGAGDANVAGARIGRVTLNLYLDPADKRGFMVDEMSPGLLKVVGTSGDVVRWAVWGGQL